MWGETKRLSYSFGYFLFLLFFLLFFVYTDIFYNCYNHSAMIYCRVTFYEFEIKFLRTLNREEYKCTRLSKDSN